MRWTELNSGELKKGRFEEQRVLIPGVEFCGIGERFGYLE
jgi:hypothetical protein